MQMEDVLGNKTRLKILKILLRLSELNVSEIARRLRTNHKTTVTHLKILENEGILQHKTFGRVRIYRFNESSRRARAVKNFIEAWETMEQH